MAKKSNSIQTSLFEETSKQGVVKIQNTQNTLSKEQIAFNKLTEKIEKLNKTLQTESVKLENRLAYYYKEVSPVAEKLDNSRANALKFVAKLLENQKFSKKDIQLLKSFIDYLFIEIGNSLSDDEELEKIRNKYSSEQSEEYQELMGTVGKDILEQQIRDMLGVEVDLSDIDLSVPNEETQAKIQERIEAAMQEKGINGFANAPQSKNKKPKKKTKAQLNKEAIEKEKEDLKSKSIRTIYLSLAKALHPDLETDIDKKLEKEELMKAVTKAYENKDLTTLLKYEIEWVNKEKENLANLSAQKLQAYTEILKEQVHELERELFLLKNNPRFQVIREYPIHNDKYFENGIKDKIMSFENNNEILENLQFDLEDFKLHKRRFLNTVEEIVEEIEMQMNFWDF